MQIVLAPLSSMLRILAIRVCAFPGRPYDPAPMLGTRPGNLVLQLGVVVLSLIWGSTWLVIRGGLEDLPPLSSCAVRFVLAGAVFAGIAPRLARVEGGTTPTWNMRLVYGVLVILIPYAVIYWAETTLPSGLVSVLWSIYPVLLAFSAHVLLPSERLRPRQWLGLVLGFAGVASMLWTDVASIGPEAVPVALVLLLSPLSSAIGTPLLKRTNAGTSSALLNRDGILVGAVLSSALALALERDSETTWSSSAVLSVLYLALVGTVLAFGLYFWLLRHAPATYLSVIAFLVPLVALSLGAAVGGEPVFVHTLGGMALILGGVGLVVRGKRR